MSRTKRVLTSDETDTLRSDVEGGMSVVASAKLRKVPLVAAQEAAKAGAIRGKTGRAMAVDRRCMVCKERKPLTEFVKNHTKSGGYDYRCTRCNRLQRLAYEAKRLGVTLSGDPVLDAMSAAPVVPSVVEIYIDDV
jgi:hypothetical protein